MNNLRLLNISFRYKIPLWGSLLIVVTALAVAAALMLRAYSDVRQDMQASSSSLARSLAVTLFPVMLNDDVWRAFEIINASLSDVPADEPTRAQWVLVLDKAQRVYVSTDPQRLPMLAQLAQLGREEAALAGRIGDMTSDQPVLVRLPDARLDYLVVPVSHEELRLGTLVIAHGEDGILGRFWGVAWRGGVAGLLVLAVLLPINWYWGQRMAVPLVELGARMQRLSHELPEDDLDADLYAYRDELGLLFESYRHMLKSLREKAALEREMVVTERLAAIGRLAGGIAHEINNPIGGMLTAIDTLKCHAQMTSQVQKTVLLIERGLRQIQETVAAPLVEAKLTSRQLSYQDIEDVHTLLAPQAHKNGQRILWRNTLAGSVPLPAAPVRQILINLLLNAVRAAPAGGEIECVAVSAQTGLTLTVANEGAMLSAVQMEHLFEPFSLGSESRRGLGLWVVYQIVQQLGGRISVARVNERTCFVAHLPTGDRR